MRTWMRLGVTLCLIWAVASMVKHYVDESDRADRVFLSAFMICRAAHRDTTSEAPHAGTACIGEAHRVADDGVRDEVLAKVLAAGLLPAGMAGALAALYYLRRRPTWRRASLGTALLHWLPH